MEMARTQVRYLLLIREQIHQNDWTNEWKRNHFLLKNYSICLAWCRQDGESLKTGDLAENTAVLLSVVRANSRCDGEKKSSQCSQLYYILLDFFSYIWYKFRAEHWIPIQVVLKRAQSRSEQSERVMQCNRCTCIMLSILSFCTAKIQLKFKYVSSRNG